MIRGGGAPVAIRRFFPEDGQGGGGLPEEDNTALALPLAAVFCLAVRRRRTGGAAFVRSRRRRRRRLYFPRVDEAVPVPLQVRSPVHESHRQEHLPAPPHPPHVPPVARSLAGVYPTILTKSGIGVQVAAVQVEHMGAGPHLSGGRGGVFFCSRCGGDDVAAEQAERLGQRRSPHRGGGGGCGGGRRRRRKRRGQGRGWGRFR